MPSRVLLCGEAPGYEEDLQGKPFVGSSGIELTRYLKSAGIDRNDVYVTNLVKERPPWIAGKQQPPSPDDIKRDEEELLNELEVVQPEIICTIGRYSTRHFLPNAEMSLVHGVPHRVNGHVILPAFHPAAGMHSPEEQPKIYWDFQQLGRLLRAEIPPHQPVDEYTSPNYWRCRDDYVTSGNDADQDVVSYLLAGETIVAIDTEGTIAQPEMLSFSLHRGHGIVVGTDSPKSIAALNSHINAYHGDCTVVAHYAVHDIPVLRAFGITNIPKLIDTMALSYVLGTEPQGLKALAYRHLGMVMESYEDLIYDAEQRTALNYLKGIWESKVCGVCWGSGKIAGVGKRGQRLKSEQKCGACCDGARLPAPEQRLVWKAGELKIGRSWSLSRSIRTKLFQIDLLDVEEEDTDADDDATESERKTYAIRRWWGKRAEKTPAAVDAVEAEFGPMPRTTLADVGDPERVKRYSARDADATIGVYRKLTPKVEELGLTRRAEIIYGAIPMFERMERIGMRIDRPYLKEFHDELDLDLDRILQRLKWLTGEPQNPQSPKIADLLFREMQLPVIKLTKGKSRESVDDKVLETLKSQLQRRDDETGKLAIQVIDLITEYREKNKLDGTYILPMQRHADKDDRVHTQITYTRTSTGRPASRNPNLQNIPIKTELGKRVRNAFVAKPGCKLISADFSQIELVIMAHESQDPGMLDTFRTGKDAHIAGAARMFEIPYEAVTKEQRFSCKNLNFGVPYGISAMGLRAQYALRGIVKSDPECGEMIERYFAAHPGVKTYMQRVYAEAKRYGFVREHIGGGIRWCPGARSELSWIREAALREAGNYPMQGGAASLLEIAMANIWRDLLPLLWGHGIDIEPLVPVHDELVFECEEEFAEMAGGMIANEMKYAVELSIPINVGVAVGDRWGDLKS